nr:hypothetical protein [Desulfovibrio desulfuricans]
MEDRPLSHLNHAYAHVVFEILLAFAAAGGAWRRHEAGEGYLLPAFFAAARAAVAQQGHKALQLLNALRAASRAAMSDMGGLKLACRVKFVRAVLGLKNIAQLGKSVHFVFQFTL